MDNFYLITFKNTHEAMKADKFREKNSIKATVMPTPTVITKSCGISIKLEENDYTRLQEIANDEIELKNIFFRTPEGFKVIK